MTTNVFKSLNNYLDLLILTASRLLVLLYGYLKRWSSHYELNLLNVKNDKLKVHLRILFIKYSPKL